MQIELRHPQATLPARQRAGDLGYDLTAVEHVTLAPGERRVVDTGVAIALDDGVAGLVLPRSGLAAKHAISVVNAPGLIDGGYRNTIGVILINHGTDPFEVGVGDRIAQLLLVPVLRPELRVVDRLPSAPDGRELQGFGSSGR